MVPDFAEQCQQTHDLIRWKPQMQKHTGLNFHPSQSQDGLHLDFYD